MAEGLRIEDGLRRNGVPAEIDLQNRSLKGQLKQANKQGGCLCSYHWRTGAETEDGGCS